MTAAPRGHRFIRWMTVPVTAGMWIALCPVPGTAATQPPSLPLTTAGPSDNLTVTPHDGLRDGQVVQVHMTGLPPDQRVVIVQCAEENPVQQEHCNLSNARINVLDHSGGANTQLTVTVGPFGNGNVSCSPSHRCVVVVQGLAMQNAANGFARIAFSAHPGDPNSLFATRTGLGIAIMIVVVVIFLLVEAETWSVLGHRLPSRRGISS